MDNTNYHRGGAYNTRDAIRAFHSNGYGRGEGDGYGVGSGIYIEGWMRYGGVMYCTTNEKIEVIYNEPKIYVMNVRGKPAPVSSLMNHNGGGKGKGGYGYGCGICHNNSDIITDNKGISWCNKIIPVEVGIGKFHN